ncbi:MAG: S6e family ribosomal protein [Promethearchaeota archaeon]
MSEGITYRIVISKDNKSMQITVEPDVFFKSLIGKKIGDELDGGLFGYPGYIFEIRGGSDLAGFPMRKDVQGGVKKRIFVSGPGTGIKNKSIRKGDRIRKLVRGNTITDQIVQINTIVKKEGKVQLFVESDDKEESNE